MFNIFKRKKSNNLLFGRKMYITDGIPDNGISSNEIIVPIRKNLPLCWKNLSPSNIKSLVIDDPDYWEGSELKLTAKYCPSFVDLFRNSYVVKSPCDVVIQINGDNNQFRWKTVKDAQDYFMLTSHSFEKQLFTKNEVKNLLNLKFTFTFGLKTTNKNLPLIFLDPLYYQKSKLKVLPGVVTVTPDYPIPLNINCYIDFDEFNNGVESIVIEKGQVIAILYSPNGVIPIKEDPSILAIPRASFVGDYLKKIKLKKKDNV